jgi:hypothetical protein
MEFQTLRGHCLRRQSNIVYLPLVTQLHQVYRAVARHNVHSCEPDAENFEDYTVW